MESLSLGALVEGLDGSLYDSNGDVSSFDIPIRAVEYNSRAVGYGSLFVCIKGEKVDGHDFAAAAVDGGAVVLAVERHLPLDVPQVVFEDTRAALALLSQRFYGDPSAGLSVAAVTGTNGKTTTAYLIEWICRFALADAGGGTLDDAAMKTGLIGTVETRIGKNRLPSKHTTPESSDLQGLFAEMRQAGVDHVSMEVSSHAVELQRVTGVHFALAAFTNLTQDHLDFHGSMDNYFDAKAALFESAAVKNRIIDIDTDYGKRLYDRVLHCGYSALTCGLSKEATVRGEDIVYGTDKTTITLVTPAGRYTLGYPLIGAFNVSNVLLAAGSASLLGFGWPVIVRALERCPQVPGRMEHVEITPDADGGSASTLPDVFVDYSHTPDSIVKAIHALSEVKAGRLIIVFGCGGDRDKTKRPLMGRAALNADYAVVTSDNPRSEDPSAIIDDILEGMRGHEDRYAVESDRAAAIALALEKADAGDFVLIAGKGHEDYQLVGDRVLDFDDRLVAAEKLLGLARDRLGKEA